MSGRPVSSIRMMRYRSHQAGQKVSTVTRGKSARTPRVEITKMEASCTACRALSTSGRGEDTNTTPRARPRIRRPSRLAGGQMIVSWSTMHGLDGRCCWKVRRFCRGRVYDGCRGRRSTQDGGRAAETCPRRGRGPRRMHRGHCKAFTHLSRVISCQEFLTWWSVE